MVAYFPLVSNVMSFSPTAPDSPALAGCSLGKKGTEAVFSMERATPQEIKTS